MDAAERFSQLWQGLTRNQRRFVAVSGDYASKREAAEAIGLAANTVYHWPREVDEAIELLQVDRLGGAREELRAAVVKAALVKTEGLDEDDARLRQSAASEILDRVLGKASSRPETAGEEGPLEIVVNYGDGDA